MKVRKSNVRLDESYRNILVTDFETEYAELEDVSSVEKIVQVMNNVFGLSDHAEEYFYLIAMTMDCKPIDFFEVSHGSCVAAMVGMREIFIRLLLCGASGFVVVHNHPGGNPEPSAADIVVTKQIVAVARLIGIEMYDHIIIGREGYYSFAKTPCFDYQEEIEMARKICAGIENERQLQE